MPLLYNNATPPRKLYVLRRISSGEVLKHFIIYPNAVDDAPINGLDPDLEFLAMDRDIEPDYDPRLYILGTAEDKEGTLWHMSYTTEKRPVEQIKIEVQNVEKSKVQDHVKSDEMNKLAILGLGILVSLKADLILTVEQEAVKARLIAAATELWKNDANTARLFAELDLGATPDLDSGWAAKP